MVPLSVVRPRLNSDEVSEIMDGLRLRLLQLREKGDWERAEIAFRILYRLIWVDKGKRPDYPEFTWENLRLLLEQSFPEGDRLNF